MVRSSRKWITNELPRYISVQGSAVREQIVQSVMLDFEICDLLVRRFTQLDCRMEPNSCKIRWRHFLESDFSVFVLAGADVTSLMSVRQQFIGEDVKYNMSSTRMFAVPAFVTDYWSAYMFDMKEECIHVIDPLLQYQPTGKMKELHMNSVNLIQDKLFDCFDFFFDN